MNKEDFVLPLLNGKEWAGEHMQIEAEPRAKVVFHGAFRAQVNWGSGKTDPNGLLTLGETYVVKQVDIHGSYTNVQVEGFSQWFPSGCFHDLKDDGPEHWEYPKKEAEPKAEPVHDCDRCGGDGLEYDAVSNRTVNYIVCRGTGEVEAKPGPAMLDQVTALELELVMTLRKLVNSCSNMPCICCKCVSVCPTRGRLKALGAKHGV